MSTMSQGCSHYLEFKRSKGLKSYHIIYKYLVKPTQERRKLKVSIFLCG